MANIEAALAILGAETARSLEALAKLREGGALDLGRASIEKRIKAEPEAVARVNDACRTFVRTQRLPNLSFDDARSVHDRMIEGMHFARWAGTLLHPLPERDIEWWLDFLLIASWDYVGRARWRDRPNAMYP